MNYTIDSQMTGSLQLVNSPHRIIQKDLDLQCHGVHIGRRIRNNIFSRGKNWKYRMSFAVSVCVGVGRGGGVGCREVAFISCRYGLLQ